MFVKVIEKRQKILFGYIIKNYKIMENLVLTKSSLDLIKSSIIQGLEIASGSRSSATYYHSRDEQMKAIHGQIDKLYKLSKELRSEERRVGKEC